MSSNRTTSGSTSNPGSFNIPSQPMTIAHRSLSQSAAPSAQSGGSMPGSPSGLSMLQNSNIPFIRRLFPPPPVLSTSVPTETSMDHAMSHRHGGPIALSYRRHSIDVSSLRSMRAADEASHSEHNSSAFVDEEVDASSLSAKANGQQGPARVLEGFCKYEWDFSG